MKFSTNLAGILLAALLLPALAACSGLGLSDRVDERLTERTGLTKVERCAGYSRDIDSLELAAEAGGVLTPEHEDRLNRLRLLRTIVCGSVEATPRPGE